LGATIASEFELLEISLFVKFVWVEKEAKPFSKESRHGYGRR